MPSVIVKKTFKIKPSGFKVANEKSWTLHGRSVTQQMVLNLNAALDSIKFHPKSNRVQFGLDQETGHYKAFMNHDAQKYNEEDITCAIMDTMEMLGWGFKFQYDQELTSEKFSGSPFTSREIFLFHKKDS